MYSTSSGDHPSGSAPRRAFVEGWRRRAVEDGIRVVLLFVLCIGIGFAFNRLRSSPLPWVYRSAAERMRVAVKALQTSSPVAEPLAGMPKTKPRIVDLETFQAFVFDHQGVVIDARAAAFYRQGHVPEALSLPREEFSTVYPALAASLESWKGKEIAIYCSDADCPDAGLVADALIGLGFSSVVVYQEGWEEWNRAGLPQETGTK